MKTILSNLLILALNGAYCCAQTDHLSSLPQAKRDSILTTVAKATMLRYAPEWYHASLTPEIEFSGYSKASNPEHHNRLFYSVTYRVDKSKIPSSWPFLASVDIWEDTGKAIGITVGPGWYKGDLDTNPETTKEGKPRPPIRFPKNIKRPFNDRE